MLALVKAFLKAGVLTETGQREYSHTGTAQGGILSPLIFNVAMSALDEHLHAPWKPGGVMATRSRRGWRQAKGQPNWRIVRYCDDFVVLVHGTQADAQALREETARVLAPMGLRLSEAKTRIVHMSEAFDFLGYADASVMPRRARKPWLKWEDSFPARRSRSAVQSWLRKASSESGAV